MILHQALGDIPQHGWCFRGSDGLLVHELCGPARSQPAITKVSRQIRAVALPLFYARFVFSFTRYDLVNPRRVMISHVHCLAERARLLRRIDIDFAPCGSRARHVIVVSTSNYGKHALVAYQASVSFCDESRECGTCSHYIQGIQTYIDESVSPLYQGPGFCWKQILALLRFAHRWGSLLRSARQVNCEGATHSL